MSRLPHTIGTFTGEAFDFYAPEISLIDVARGLSKECRFARQTSKFYSVAEHSVLVSQMVLDRTRNRELALAALWHDAHEAYMGDLPKPLKKIIGKRYEAIAQVIDAAVGRFIGVRTDLRHPIIKWADEAAMLYEASMFMSSGDWGFAREMDHPEAEEAVKKFGENWSERQLGRSHEAAYRLFVNAHTSLKKVKP